MAEAQSYPADDPRAMLGRSRMGWRQIAAIASCVALNALDGFDVLSISFASPGIAREWGIDRAALGVVLSMELIGMAAGSVGLGQVADRVGRRPTVFICLAIMATGMLATTQVGGQGGGIGALAATRLLTGLGIGGMLATTNALVAEYANDRWRGTVVAIMAAGFPLGAVLGGTIASVLLESSGWRSVFYLGALMTALFLPLAPLLLPEPVGALMQRRGPGTLARVNHTLRVFGHDAVASLPPPEPAARKPSVAELFSPGLRTVTLALAAAYSLHIMTFYFLLKWVPKIVADMGFSAAAAGGVLVWANLGGLAGSLLFSALSVRFALRGLLACALFGSAVLVALFGLVPPDLASLSWAVATASIFTNAAVVCLYALMASSYPTAVRAGGTGLVLGIGRGGSALGPILGGFLFQMGLGLPVVAAIMACGSLAGMLAVLALPRRAAEGL